jgi:hypothetical protein
VSPRKQRSNNSDQHPVQSIDQNAYPLNSWNLLQRAEHEEVCIPSIRAVSSGFMGQNYTRASGCLFRHVTNIDHHYSDVVGLGAGAPVLGPPKHLINQTLGKLLRRKILVGRNELA